MDLSEFVSTHAGPIWAAVSSIVGGIGAWILSRRNIDALVERARIETHAEVSASEAKERTAFREALVTEIMGLRELLKQCEADKEALRQRLNAAMAQSLVLRATVEIMEKRVSLGRDRHTPSTQTDPADTPHVDIT